METLKLPYVMSYSRINLLRKILIIQQIYTTHNKQGVSNEFIFTHYIEPNYFISKASFYRYLAVNAKKELKKLEQEVAV